MTLSARAASSRLFIVALALAALGFVGCGKDEAPSASDVVDAPPADETSAAPPAEAPPLPAGSLEAVALELGVALDADGRVSMPVDRVRPNDTVHLSLVTIGETEAAMLAVHWRDAAGTALAADERAISASGPAVHTFSRKPDAGWAPGRYEAEVTLGGQSAGVRGFEVR